MLEMKHITKRFPGIVALDDVSLSLERGQVHALVGENGAGKSTLMKVLSGVIEANEGELLIDGQPIHPTRTRESESLGINIIFQEFSLVPDLNAYENIFLGREIRTRFGTLDRRTMRRMAREGLDKLDMRFPLDRPVVNLTVAEQQSVEIVKATIFKCNFLVLDEPTATLTPREVKKLFEVIERLKALGVGCFFISHHLEEIFQIADTVSVLRDGRHVFTGPVRSCTQDELIAKMVGREVTQAFPPKLAAPETGSAPIMQVRKLRFPGSDAISFEVRRGEILGVAGLVGAKRTESFLALIGRNPSLEKDVLFEGKPIELRSPHEALAQGIGYLPEDRKRTGLFLSFTIRANVVMSILERLTNKFGMVVASQEKSLSDRFIQRMRIRTTSDLKTVSELSGGNQQKVIIARWLASNCKLLVFDEPTRGIDVGAKAEIYVMLQELVAQGLGVVVISSDLPEVIGVCDRVLVMRYGSIRAELTGAEINSEKIMFYASGGENE